MSASSTSLHRKVIAVAARNSVFVLGAQVLIKIMAFLFNVYVVRRLGPVHFGQYSAVMAYVTIFAIFTDLGMAPYSVREMAEDRSRTGLLLPNIIAIRVLLSLLIVVVAPLSAWWLGKGSDMVWGVFVASLGLVLYAFQGPLDSALTARERLDYTAVFAVVNQLVFWGLGTLLLLKGMGFIGLLLASLVGVAVVAVLSGRALLGMDVGKLCLVPSRWPAILKAALPFGISSLAGAFLRRFDTVLMSFVLTDAAVGWYNAPYSLLNMMIVLAQSIAIALYPSMVRGYSVDSNSLDDVVQRAVRYLLIIVLPIAVGVSVLADKIITLLYTSQYSPSIAVLRIAVWALPGIFLLEVLGRAANTLHMERQAAKINLINAAITISLNLVLVPTLGVVGGALALALGRTVRLGQFWALIGSKRIVGQRWSLWLRTSLAAILMGIAVFFLRPFHLLVGIGVGAVLYAGLLFALQVVGFDEVRFLLGACLRRGRA